MNSDDFRRVLDAYHLRMDLEQGALRQQFEADFSRFVGVACVAFERHRGAAPGAGRSRHRARGDEVILPDLTFAATINAVPLLRRHAGDRRSSIARPGA